MGASHAGVSLALQLRKEDWQGAIQLIGAETELPYHRPPLSKELLAGSKTLDAIRLRPEKLYHDNDIELLLGKAVSQINRTDCSVQLENLNALSYSKLALCTGSSLRKLPFAVTARNVFYVRTASDVAALAPLVYTGMRAVVIGAGYIGLETAAVLSQQGVKVTVLEMAARILNRVTGEQLSRYMLQLHRAMGVEVFASTVVTAIEGGISIATVRCADGTVFQAELVIVGIGVIPNTELAEAAGLGVDGGILVNSNACTSDPSIYAAGDCTRHPSAIYGRMLRLESVQNANDQARVAASNICGKPLAYDAVPWFWSDQYKIKLQMAGLSENFDKVTCRGDSLNSDGRGFALFYFRNEVLIAVDCVDRPKEFMVSKQLVKAGVKLDGNWLADESVEPASFLKALDNQSPV